MGFHRLVQAALVAAVALGIVAPSASGASIWSPIAVGHVVGDHRHRVPVRRALLVRDGERTRSSPGSRPGRSCGPSGRAPIRLTDIAFQKDGGRSASRSVTPARCCARSTAARTWTNVNPIGTPIPASQNDTTFADCTATDPLGNVNSVRFAGQRPRVHHGPGRPVLDLAAARRPRTSGRSEPGRTPTATPRDGHPTDDTCRLGTSYGSGIGDAFFASNPNVFYVCTAFFGELFFTTNNLATNATKKPGAAATAASVIRRITGDPANPQPQWAVGPGGDGHLVHRAHAGRLGDRGELQDRQRVRARGGHASTTSRPRGTRSSPSATPARSSTPATATRSSTTRPTARTPPAAARDERRVADAGRRRRQRRRAPPQHPGERDARPRPAGRRGQRARRRARPASRSRSPRTSPTTRAAPGIDPAGFTWSRHRLPGGDRQPRGDHLPERRVLHPSRSRSRTSRATPPTASAVDPDQQRGPAAAARP